MAKTKQSNTDEIREEIKANAGKVWLAGLGALATAEEQGGKLFRSLVKKGEQYEKKGKSQFEKLKAKVEDLADAAKAKAEGAWEKVEEKAGDVEERWDDKMVGALRKIGVPSRNEIASLTHRVEELTSLVEKKVGTSSAKSRRPAATKAAKKATRKTAKKSTAGKAASRRSR
ncbi:MAG: phasin family protein [Thermoanaerobaculia bacterium]